MAHFDLKDQKPPAERRDFLRFALTGLAGIMAGSLPALVWSRSGGIMATSKNPSKSVVVTIVSAKTPFKSNPSYSGRGIETVDNALKEHALYDAYHDEVQKFVRSGQLLSVNYNIVSSEIATATYTFTAETDPSALLASPILNLVATKLERHQIRTNIS